MDLIHDSLSRMGAKSITRTSEGWECQCPIRGCEGSGRSFRVAFIGKHGRPGEFICHRCKRRGDMVGLVMRSQCCDRGTAELRVKEVMPYFRRESRRGREWERPDISEWAPYRSICSQWLLDEGYDQEWIWHYEIGYDRWSQEIVIPTKDETGQLVGITRRLACGGQNYFHSEFPKSDYLYGLHQAIASGETGVYVTEGQRDPLGLAPRVSLPVVSTIGSSLSENQAKLLSRFFCTVVMAYDNDNPGYYGVDTAVPVLRRCGIHDLLVLDYDAADPGKLIEVDEPNFQHLTYLAWRRVKERPPIKKRRKNYVNAWQ